MITWFSSRRTLILLSPLLLLLVGPAALRAQAVRGAVLAAGSGDPLEGVTVGLLDTDDRVVVGAISDEEGRFLIKAPWTGRFRIRFERLGYASATSAAVDLLPPDTVEVEMRLDVEAVEMAPLTIVSDRVPLLLDTRLARWGYYEREEQYRGRGTGVAHFIDQEAIRRRNPGRVTDMFTMLSGVRVVQSGRRGVKVVTTRGINRACEMDVFLDGVRLPLANDESMNDYVSALNLSAIEVYVRAPYPVEYAPNPMGCGCVLLWTGFTEGRGGG